MLPVRVCSCPPKHPSVRILLPIVITAQLFEIGPPNVCRICTSYMWVSSVVVDLGQFVQGQWPLNL
jgi:hypothetical protein